MTAASRRAMMAPWSHSGSTNQKRVIIVVGALVAVVALVLGIVIVTQATTTTTDRPPHRRSTTTVDDRTTTSTTRRTTSTTIDPRRPRPGRCSPTCAAATASTTPGRWSGRSPPRCSASTPTSCVGDFRQGDNRSGEVEVSRPRGTARPRSPCGSSPSGSWVVVGASTETIRLDTPIAARAHQLAAAAHRRGERVRGPRRRDALRGRQRRADRHHVRARARRRRARATSAGAAARSRPRGRHPRRAGALRARAREDGHDRRRHRHPRPLLGDQVELSSGSGRPCRGRRRAHRCSRPGPWSAW